MHLLFLPNLVELSFGLCLIYNYHLNGKFEFGTKDIAAVCCCCCIFVV